MLHLAYWCANESHWQDFRSSVEELDKAKERLSTTLKQIRERIERDLELTPPPVPPTF
jgi:hypothetical protein